MYRRTMPEYPVPVPVYPCTGTCKRYCREAAGGGKAFARSTVYGHAAALTPVSLREPELGGSAAECWGARVSTGRGGGHTESCGPGAHAAC
eukprot:COSAG02_NODE_361_length_23829_cov_82.704509_8_plen_91_part_00